MSKENAPPPPDGGLGDLPIQEQPTGGGGHGGASGRWLVSYADFITLMMVVFMVMYSMARVDNAKFGKLKASLASSSIGGGALTPLPVGGNPINTAPTVPGPDPSSYPGAPEPSYRRLVIPAPAPPEPLPEAEPAVEEPEAAVPAPKPKAEPEPQPKPAPVQTPPPAPPPDPLAPLKGGLLATVSGQTGAFSVQIQDRGLMVSVVTSLLFKAGSAELKPEAPAVLDSISQELAKTEAPILVEGAPDSGEQEAPWDLAARRASTVVSYLVTKHGLSGDRFAVVGHGKGAGTDGIVNVVVLRRR